MRAIRQRIKSTVERCGYKVYKRDYMPFGIDHALDIRRFVDDPKSIEVIFDIGANEGQTAIMYAKEFPWATIHSFEPVVSTFYHLQENTRTHSNIRVHNFAFGNKPGFVEIQLRHNSVLNRIANNLGDNSGGPTETIRVETVDAFMKSEGINRIQILKSDTEGFDLKVLEGANQVLSASKQLFVYIETTFLAGDTVHTSFREAADFLRLLGYEFVGIYDQDYISFAPRRPPLSYCNSLFYKL